MTVITSTSAADCSSTEDLLDEAGRFFCGAVGNQTTKLRIVFPKQTTVTMGFNVGWKGDAVENTPEKIHRITIRYSLRASQKMKVRNTHLYSSEDISGNLSNKFEWTTHIRYTHGEITREQNEILNKIRAIMIKYMGAITPRTSERDLVVLNKNS